MSETHSCLFGVSNGEIKEKSYWCKMQSGGETCENDSTERIEDLL